MTTRASRLFAKSLEIHKPPLAGAFLPDYLRTTGALDVDWTGQLANEGGWSVITTDYKNPKGTAARLKGPPLNILLPERGITGFFFAGRIATRSGFEKMRAIFYCFPKIIERIESHTPGTRFKVHEQKGGNYTLVKWRLKK
jgi:hypothetical protein